jgi:ATPases involved in chromosome partitioning
MFNSKLNEVIHSTYIPQLFVLPAGSIIPSTPSELLQSEGMKRLLERLNNDFDYLVIDSSPAVGLADSLMISTISDGTVIVSSAGITMQRDISHLVKRLSDINARFLGVVINRLELGREAYFYDRYYKSYYDGGTKENTIEIGRNHETSQAPEYQGQSDEKGSLKDISYPSLLLSFQNRGKTGILNIDSELKLKIYLQEGFPVFAEGGDTSTLLGSIATAEGRIQKQDLETALDNVVRTNKKIGEVLIGMGFISHHELDRLLEHQVKEKLIKGFRCTQGTYDFKAISSFIGSILTYKVNPLYVIYEGVKRFGNVKEIEKRFSVIKESAKLSSQKIHMRLDDPQLFVEANQTEKEVSDLEGLIIISLSELVEKLRDISFSPGEFRFLKSLRESQNLEDILSNNRLSREDTLRLLYFLNLVGLVEIKVNDSNLKSDGDLYPKDKFSSQGG